MKKLWILLLLSLLLFGCATQRKLHVASVLKECKPQVRAVAIDSFVLDSIAFPKAGAEAFPNAFILPLAQKLMAGQLDQTLGTAHLRISLDIENKGKDSVWVSALQGTAWFDTLISAPLRLASPGALRPGANQMDFLLEVPVDGRVFQLTKARSYRLQGVMTALYDGNEVPLSFDESKPLTEEKVNELARIAQQSLVQSTLEKWVGSLR